MKIICGTDFSREAAEVASLAARVADTGNVHGTVELAHVLEKKSALRRVAKPDAQAASAEKRLAAEAQRLRRNGTVVTTRLLDGNTDQTLLDADTGEAADLVMLSSLSGGAPGRFPLGRTCELMLERSPVPVLIVRNVPPLLEWLEGTRPLRVFCAFDFTRSARRALAWVPRLAKRQPCEIIVAHVTDTAAHADDVGLTTHGHGEEPDPSADELLHAEISRRVDRVLGGLDYRILISDHLGAPAKRLLHLADREGADLIIVGSHQRSRGEMVLTGSMSQDMAREGSQNLLVVPLRAPGPVEFYPPIERMLIATDLSPECNLAARRAVAMAPVGAEIVLATVLHPRELPNREFVRNVTDPRFIAGHADWIQRSFDALSELIPDGADEARMHVEVVEDEDVAEGIRRAANRFDVSVVCLATEGRTGLRALLLGSTAQDVIAILKRPILLIPPEEP